MQFIVIGRDRIFLDDATVVVDAVDDQAAIGLAEQVGIEVYRAKEAAPGPAPCRTLSYWLAQRAKRVADVEWGSRARADRLRLWRWLSIASILPSCVVLYMAIEALWIMLDLSTAVRQSPVGFIVAYRGSQITCLITGIALAIVGGFAVFAVQRYMLWLKDPMPGAEALEKLRADPATAQLCSLAPHRPAPAAPTA